MAKLDWFISGVLFGAILGAACGGMAGRALGTYQTTKKMQGEAISEGLAHYSPATGIWQWGTLHDTGLGFNITLDEGIAKIDDAALREACNAMGSKDPACAKFSKSKNAGRK